MVHHEQSTPANTPTDETIFTHPPHFDPNNPFHRSLSSLDQSLRCDICCNLYQVPVSLYPCLHTFCSLCVRKTFKSQYGSMKRKTECPQCNAVIGNGGNFEKAILPNHHLENLVSLYKNNVRGDLVKSLMRLDVLERKERMNMKLKEDEEEECNNNDGGEEQKQSMSSAKRARRSTANYKQEYSHENDDEEEDATMTVNQTDDAAATTASAEAASPLPPPAAAVAPAASTSTIQQRKRLPTKSYKHLKRRDLISDLQKYNLPTNGTDAELKHRHEEYILLYNSQCDSQHPMSEQEIIAQVMREERGRKKERVEEKMNGVSQHAVYMKRLGESLAASSSGESNGGNVVVPTTGSKKVDNEMKNTFKDMIQKVKARKKGGETTTSDDLDGDGGGKVPSCIAAAAAAAAVANGSGDSNSGGNIASKPRAKSGNASAAVASTNTTSAAAAAATVGATTMKAATSKSITNNVPKQKSTTTSTTSTPAKRSRAATTTTSKKQATVVSAKKKASGIWKCPLCTFENHKYTTAHALCEMCSSARPEKENTSNEVIAIDC